MADHPLINSYLDELRHLLRRSAEADDIVAEVADHLLEGVVRRREQGLALLVAERSVLTEFGDPMLVGRAFASSKHGGIAVPTTSTHRAGLFGILSAVLYISATVMFILADSQDVAGEDWSTATQVLWLTGSLMFLAAGLLLVGLVAGLNRRLGGALGTQGRVAGYVFGAAGVTSFAAWVWGIWLTLLVVGAAFLVAALRESGLASGPAWAGPAMIAGSSLAAGSMWIQWVLLNPSQNFGNDPTIWIVLVGLTLFAVGVFGIGNWLRSETPVDQPDNLLTV